MEANLFLLDDGHIQLTIKAENHVEAIALKTWSDSYFPPGEYQQSDAKASLLITADYEQLRALRE